MKIISMVLTQLGRQMHVQIMKTRRMLRSYPSRGLSGAQKKESRGLSINLKTVNEIPCVSKSAWRDTAGH